MKDMIKILENQLKIEEENVKKQLTNNRASGSDEALKLITPTQLSLDQCMEFIADDELVELTLSHCPSEEMYL